MAAGNGKVADGRGPRVGEPQTARTCHGCGACRRGGWARRLSFLPAVLVAVLPKCPLCVLGYASLFSAAGLWRFSSYYAAWVGPLSLAGLAAVVAVIALQAAGPGRPRRGAGPLLLGLAAAALLAFAKLRLDSGPLAALALAALLGVLVWSGRSARPLSQPSAERT